MEIEKLIKHMREEAQDYRSGRTLGRAFADAEDVLDEAATALEQLQAENEKMRAELEQVTAERDAAVEDVAAIIGDVEEIRRGYGVDNADADGAFAELCETYCANNGRLCYAECEKYHCKNFKWRGQKEE